MIGNSSELMEILIKDAVNNTDTSNADERRVLRLKENAKLMDAMAKDENAMYFDIQVQEDGTFNLMTGSYDVSVCEKISRFYELVNCSNSVKFTITEGDIIVTTFNMPGILK